MKEKLKKDSHGIARKIRVIHVDFSKPSKIQQSHNMKNKNKPIKE